MMNNTTTKQTNEAIFETDAGWYFRDEKDNDHGPYDSEYLAELQQEVYIRVFIDRNRLGEKLRWRLYCLPSYLLFRLSRRKSFLVLVGGLKTWTTCATKETLDISGMIWIMAAMFYVMCGIISYLIF